MEKLKPILLGVALLYGAYFLLLKNWDYSSQSKRKQNRESLKEKGLSSCYFFISPRKLLFLNILSGGIFFFYWIYKQWQAVLSGYKNAAGIALKYGAFWRAVAGLFSFYQLSAIIKRTCAYMHKPQGLSYLFWGTGLWLGLCMAVLPPVPFWGRVLGAYVWLTAPYFLQKKINTLPKDIPPSHLKPAELLTVVISWALWAMLIISL